MLYDPYGVDVPLNFDITHTDRAWNDGTVWQEAISCVLRLFVLHASFE